MTIADRVPDWAAIPSLARSWLNALIHRTLRAFVTLVVPASPMPIPPKTSPFHAHDVALQAAAGPPQRPPIAGLTAGLTAGLALWAAACSTPPPLPFVLLAPDIEVDEALTPGSALGPPVEAASGEALEDEDVGSPIAVRCRLMYLEAPRTQGLRSLGLGATIVADVNGSAPVLETPELTLSTLYPEGAEANDWITALGEADSHAALEIADRTVIVPQGARFQLSMRAGERVEDPRDWLDEFQNRGPIPVEAGVIVTNTGATPEIAVVVTSLDPKQERQILEDYLADPNVLATAPGPAQDELVRQEVLTLEPAPALGAPLVLHMDSPFVGGNGTSIAIVIELVEPYTVQGTNELMAAAALAATAETMREQREPLTEESRSEIERIEALSVFQRRGGRSALLQVAQESKAMLALDIALVADEAFLVLLSERAFPMEEGDLTETAPEDATALAPKASIGWRLDAAAWNLLAEGALDEALDPELEGVFYRAAGALAAFPDLVQEAVVAASGSAVRFHDRLLVEQRYFLEDSAPSSRLRAYDWLKERGVVVPDYDPLGERDERRAALEADAANKSTDPVGGKQ